MDTPFSQDTRTAHLTALERDPVDLLVIGAGITGAGIARDAAMRGMRVAVIDKGDFGSGTSGRSSRLVHGGLRYLELGNWRLVREASRERRILLSIAPHLVRPRSFLFPVYAGGRVPLWKLAAGLWLYDLLALFRNVRAHRMLSKRALLRAEPGLRAHGLRGGARYFDAQCDDARLTLANVRSAFQHGARVANYVEARRFLLADGRIAGVQALDRITAREFTVRALAVVNATGPWSDGLRGGLGEPPMLRRTKGVHVMVPRERLGNHEAVAITSPLDGRVMFVLPWGDLSYIGTTDTDTDVEPDAVRGSGEDVVYLLRSANAYFPGARLTAADAVATWGGLRPLLKPPGSSGPSAVSREHRIVESPQGLVSIVGGKLTTYRVMAQQVVDRIAWRLHQLDGRRVAPRPPTHREPLPGGEARDLEVVEREVEREGITRLVAEHLVRCYGTEAIAVARLARSDPTLREPIVPGHLALRAELLHAMRREMAMTLCDLLIRRTHVFYETLAQAVPEAPALLELAAAELGWSPARKAQELVAYLQEVERAAAFRREMGREAIND